MAVLAGPGTHYGFDFPNATLRKFLVECVGSGTLSVPDDGSGGKAGIGAKPRMEG